jgi:hypothetical protein
MLRNFSRDPWLRKAKCVISMKVCVENIIGVDMLKSM